MIALRGVVMVDDREAREKPPSLIEAMARPEFYPDRPANVELRQTHISYVFLAGEYVYKVKKPVRFSFLDYSTLCKRYHFCQEELRLNRRLAPTVYLEVVPIMQREGKYALGEQLRTAGRWTLAEYAVKMRRLPEKRMLDTMVKEGRVGKEEIHAIVERLVSFHLAAATDRASVFGAPETIWLKFANNFKETERLIGQTITQKESRAIQEFGRRFLMENRDLLQARLCQQRIREGHGDLRAEHICLTGDIVVYDCIEFDERLRYCDVASEIAFLAMDLDFLGASKLSEELVAAYREIAQDETLCQLLSFYKCYRAYVRGKVESLKSQEKEVPDAERNLSKAQAKRYFHLAYRYAKGTPAPALLIVCGLVGTGKSTTARLLGDLTGFVVFNSDSVRKRLAHIPPTARVQSGYRTGIYSDNSTRLTYEILLAEAERTLKDGRGVIVDATLKDPRHRGHFLNLAARLKIPILFAECQAQGRDIFRRLQERGSLRDEVSDATWNVYLRHQENFVPLTDIPDDRHLTVNTETALEEGITRIEEFLWNRGNYEIPNSSIFR
ncbi:MAG: AAA family ATPase [Candidatus Binatia bacterium]